MLLCLPDHGFAIRIAATGPPDDGVLVAGTPYDRVSFVAGAPHDGVSFVVGSIHAAGPWHLTVCAVTCRPPDNVHREALAQSPRPRDLLATGISAEHTPFDRLSASRRG